MRIVSLLGSATEIIHHLGLERYLVGISHECDHPPAALSLPRVSRPRFDPSGMTSGEVDAAVRRAMDEGEGVYEIDRRLLAELRPTLVLTQRVCEVCAVPTDSATAALAALDSAARVVSLDAHDLNGILASIVQVADAVGERELGIAAADRLRERVDIVRERLVNAERPSVLMLEWLDPPFVPGHWVPEMVEIAGGRNLAGRAGKRSIQVEWKDLVGLDPDVLLIEPCGYDLDTAVRDADRHLERLLAVGMRPIRERRAWVLHSAWFSRSGPRVVEGIELLASILHPTLIPGPPNPEIARSFPTQAVAVQGQERTQEL